MFDILVNDIFDELSNENNRLLNELLFANKCLKVLAETKTFFDLNSKQIKLNLVSNQLKIYENLCEKLRQILDEKKILVQNFKIEEKTNFEDNETEEKKTLRIGLKKRVRPRVKASDKKLNCDWMGCHFETLYRDELLKHKKIHSEKKYVCDRLDCQYKTYKKCDLRRHNKVHESKIRYHSKGIESQKNIKEPKDVSNCQLICHFNDCGKEFKNKKNFEKHLEEHQFHDGNGCLENETNSLNESTEQKTIVTNGSLKTELVCDYSNCGQQFTSQKRFDYHLWKHQKNEKRFVCDYPGCGYKCNVRVSLKSHIRIHTGEKPFECSDCKKRFACKKVLKQHYNRIHNLTEEVLVCGIDGCDKRFQTEASFKWHQKFKHLIEKRFVCDHPNCDFRAVFKFGLQRHIRSNHSNARPFKCHFEGCDKSFKANSNLRAHILLHTTTEATIKCPNPGCDKLFKFENNLKKHIERTHSDNWMYCDWPGCEYKSRRKSTLEKHAVSHTAEYNVHCIWPNCNKSFKTKEHIECTRISCTKLQDASRASRASWIKYFIL